MTNKRENNPKLFPWKRTIYFFFTVCCDSIDPQLLAQNFLVSLSSLGLEGFDEVDILDPLRLDKPLRMGQDVMLKKKNNMENKNKAKWAAKKA